MHKWTNFGAVGVGHDFKFIMAIFSPVGKRENMHREGGKCKSDQKASLMDPAGGTKAAQPSAKHEKNKNKFHDRTAKVMMKN